MRITVKAGELTKEVQLSHKQARRLHEMVWQKLRAVSFAAERRVKDQMPVDTGRARASWGHWTPGDTNNRDASPRDAEWSENARELRVEQGSNVDYVPKLNAGHSQQALAGFIDAAEKQAQSELDREIEVLLSRYF